MSGAMEFSSQATSGARGDQSNRRGDSGVTINHAGPGWVQALPWVAVAVVAAYLLMRRKGGG